MGDYAPMKAVLIDNPFSDPERAFERKLDGIRCGALRRAGQVRLMSRTGQTLNATYPELVDAQEHEGTDLLADGEIVAFRGAQTSFERLQRRMQIHDPERARASGVAVYYYLFDLLELEGRDLRPLPSRARKASLRRAVEYRGHLRHPRYHGLRDDKPAREVVREAPSP